MEVPVHLWSYLYFHDSVFLVVGMHIQTNKQNIHIGRQTEAGKMMVLGKHETRK